MKFDNKYFKKFNFSKEGVNKNYENSLKDLNIAKEDDFLDVKFNYAYRSFIKLVITTLSFHNMKVRSVRGHHFKMIEVFAKILKDENVENMGNLMRSKRNRDLYTGAIDITEKECREYIEFVEGISKKVKRIIS